MPTPEPPSDREALAAFYEATDGPNWTNNTNWLSDKPLDEWFGVTTNTNGRVTKLNLTYNQLSGEMSPELAKLSNLRELWLDQNQLTGEIPPELGNLSNLERIYLHNNQLTGEIPTEIGNLYDLTNLWLSQNQFSGEFPQNWEAFPAFRPYWFLTTS